MKKNGSVFNCHQCNVSFYRSLHQIKKGYNKYCNKYCYFKTPKSETHKKNIGKAQLGRIPWNKGTKGKGSQVGWNKGGTAPWAKGELNNAWKGGITSENDKIRRSLKYKEWRISVFERDNYTCVMCHTSGSKIYLQADHIKPFAYFIELRFEVSNGRTLCIDCHKTTDTYGEKAKSYKTTHLTV